MRKSCADCCRKHLAQALVLSHELAWYNGNEEDDHLWVLVGHLAEAGDQIQKESQFIADQIRDQRLLLMREGGGAVRKLNINTLIKLVSDNHANAAQPAHPVLGSALPETDPLADRDNITKSSGKKW